MLSMSVMWLEKMAIQGLKMGVSVTKKLLLIKLLYRGVIKFNYFKFQCNKTHIHWDGTEGGWNKMYFAAF